jgi:hypothetical protein
MSESTHSEQSAETQINKTILAWVLWIGASVGFLLIYFLIQLIVNHIIVYLESSQSNFLTSGGIFKFIFDFSVLILIFSWVIRDVLPRIISNLRREGDSSIKRLPTEEKFHIALAIYVNRIRFFITFIIIAFCILGVLILWLPEPETENTRGWAGVVLLGAVSSIGIGSSAWKYYKNYYDAVTSKFLVETTLPSFKDKTLLRAWRLMFQHDLKAVAARKNFVKTRSSLIIITVLSTVAAVFATFFDKDLVLYKLLAVIALSLPIAGSAYITYIQRFSKITIWLKHRVVAERIRAEIYQYQMKVGGYKAANKLLKSDNKTNTVAPKLPSEQLNKEVHKIAKELDTEETYIAVDSKQVDAKIAKQLKKENRPNADSTLCFDSYLEIRGAQQKEWYEGRINKNYKKTQNYTSLALVFQMGGAILTALALVAGLDSKFIVFATVTNAISFGINSWITVEMTAQVYSIFNVARKQLSKHLGDWDAFTDQFPKGLSTIPKEERKAKEDSIVEAIEKTLNKEREDWYNLALQTLSSNDQALFQAIEDSQSDSPDNNGEVEDKPPNPTDTTD